MCSSLHFETLHGCALNAFSRQNRPGSETMFSSVMHLWHCPRSVARCFGTRASEPTGGIPVLIRTWELSQRFNAMQGDLKTLEDYLQAAGEAGGKEGPSKTGLFVGIWLEWKRNPKYELWRKREEQKLQACKVTLPCHGLQAFLVSPPISSHRH